MDAMSQLLATTLAAMTPTKAAAVLRQLTDWRKGVDVDPPAPLAVDKAIDAAIEMIERIPSRIAPEQAPGYVRNYSRKAAEGYADGWNACIKTIMEESK